MHHIKNGPPCIQIITFLCALAFCLSVKIWQPLHKRVESAPIPQSQSREAIEIILDFGPGGYKITKFYAKQAKKTFDVSKKVVIEQAVYGSLLKEFESGVLDLNDDKAYGLPRYNRALANDLFKSEFTLQWSMVKFLENGGISDKQNRALRLHKEMLFSTQESFEQGNKGENTFNNLRSLRRALINIRKQLR